VEVPSNPVITEIQKQPETTNREETTQKIQNHQEAIINAPESKAIKSQTESPVKEPNFNERPLKFINDKVKESSNEREERDHGSVEDLKNCFAKLRAKITCNEESEEGKEGKSNYVEMLNRLKHDMMSSKYYNNALDFKRKEDVSKTQTSNDFARAKPKTNTLQFNSQHFEINNTKNSASKVQLLEHTKQDEMFKLSFTLNQKETVKVPPKKETFNVESSSETITTKPQKKPQQQENNNANISSTQQQQYQQYNDYMREQYNTYMNSMNFGGQQQNKYNKQSNLNQYQNMFSNPYAFYNPDLKTSQETGYGMDPQQMYNNSYWQNFYGMPYGYFPYSYGVPDRNAFPNMAGNVDQSTMMNMFTNYFMNIQQQPNFYQNMPSDANAYHQK